MLNLSTNQDVAPRRNKFREMYPQVNEPGEGHNKAIALWEGMPTGLTPEEGALQQNRVLSANNAAADARTQRINQALAGTPLAGTPYGAALVDGVERDRVGGYNSGMAQVYLGNQAMERNLEYRKAGALSNLYLGRDDYNLGLADRDWAAEQYYTSLDDSRYRFDTGMEHDDRWRNVAHDYQSSRDEVADRNYMDERGRDWMWEDREWEMMMDGYDQEQELFDELLSRRRPRRGVQPESPYSVRY